MTSQSPRKRRRWFQFSLRGLMIIVTLAAGLLVAWRVITEPYRLQDEAVAELEEMGASYTTRPGPAWIAKLRRADTQVVVSVDTRSCNEPERYVPLLGRLFGVETLVVNDSGFTDEHLHTVAQLKALRALVLDSTRATPAAVAALREQRAGLAVFQTQRRALEALGKIEVFVDAELIDIPDEIKPLLTAESVAASNFRQLYNRYGALGTPVHAEAAVVDVSDKKITDAELELIATMPTLKWLRLADAPVTAEGLKLLANLDQLEWLDLSGTPIGDEAIPCLRELDRLETLWLHSTKVSDAGLQQLGNFKRLKNVDLRRTRVSDAGLNVLSEMKQLESIYLHWTAVTKHGLARLHSALPDTLVVY